LQIKSGAGRSSLRVEFPETFWKGGIGFGYQCFMILVLKFYFKIC
jgi:hypothetical protein